MRKVKLLALLLAVLMVVTAFAGCANTDVIESDVANLDERVTALENLLNGIDKEIDDLDAQIKDLGDKIDADKTADEVAALQKQLEEQKKALEEQKAAAQAAKDAADAAAKAAKDAADAQAKANADLLKQIQELMKAQEDAEKEAAKVLADAKTAALAKIATREAGLAGKYADLVAAAKAAVNAATTENACDKAVTDLEAAIAAADVAAGAAILAAAQKAAAEEIAVIREQKKDDKAMYFTDEYEAVVKALAAADTNVAAAKTAAEVDAAVATLKTELAKYAAIDDKLYDYFTKLWGNMTEANRAVNTEAQAYVVKAEKHFMDNFGTPAATPLEVPSLVAYVYGTGEDNSKLVVDLPYMLGLIDDVYTDGDYANVKFTKNHVYGTSGQVRVAYSALTADVATYSLAKAVAEAAKIDKRINDFVTNKSYAETWAFLRNTARVNDMFGVLHNDYLAWNAAVKPLAEANLALLTNGAKIERIKGIIDNYMAAEKALIDLGEINYSTQVVTHVFAKYGYANAVNDVNLFYDSDDKTFVSETVYAPIDAKISAWAKAFDLVEADMHDIIKFQIKVSYYDYLADKAYVELMDSKFASFKKDIIPLIKEVNKQTAVETASFKAYQNLLSKFNAWVCGSKVTVKINGSDVDTRTYVNAENLKLMFDLTGISPAYVGGLITNFPDGEKDVDDGNGGTIKEPVYMHAVTGDNATKAQTLKHLDPNVGQYAKTKDAVAQTNNEKLIDCKVITFDERYADELNTFFKGDYVTFSKHANAINRQITYLNDQLTKRNIYSILAILALEDKTVEYNNKGQYLPDDHIALTITNANGSKAIPESMYQYLSKKLGATGMDVTVGTSFSEFGDKLSDGKKRQNFVLADHDGDPATAEVLVTVRVFEEMCEAKDYNGLAETLIEYSRLDALKAAYADRIATLKADGANAIMAAVKAIKVNDLKQTTVNTKPGLRDYKTVYSKKDTSTTSNNVHYVTLADLDAYEAAATALDTWINDKAGNVRYQEMVDTTLKIKVVVDAAGTEKEVQYTVQKERDILQDYDLYLGNVGGQLKVLTDARDAFVEAITLVNDAIALQGNKWIAEYNVANAEAQTPSQFNVFDATKDLSSIYLVTEFKVLYNKDGEEIGHEWKELTGWGKESDTLGGEGKFIKDATKTTTYSLEAMIEDAYKAYTIFTLLDKDYTNAGKIDKVTLSNYLETYTVDGFNAYNVYNEMVLLYAKAHVVAELQKGLDSQEIAGTNKEDLVRRAIAGVLKCTKLQGTDSSAVSNWVDNYSSYVTLTEPVINGVAKRTYNSSSNTESYGTENKKVFTAKIATPAV